MDYANHLGVGYRHLEDCGIPYTEGLHLWPHEEAGIEPAELLPAMKTTAYMKL